MYFSEFAKKIGVSIQTLRDWDKSGKLKPAYRNKGNHILAKQGKEFKIIKDIGSGINYNKKGLKELLRLIATNQCDTIFVLHKDRLLRFGYELIEEFAKLHNTKIVIINKEEEKTDEEELVEDILSIIYRLNGKRSHINKKIIKRLER